MKTCLQTAVILVLFVGVILLCSITGPANAVSGSGAQVHPVVQGDTLWDVTRQYLNNPFFWPKVWQYNPHIENPHLIYPGEQVNIPSAEELARMGITKAPGTRQFQQAPIIQGPIAYVGGYLVERDLFESSGTVLGYGEDAGVGKIVSTWEEKMLLTDRDLVHINVGGRDGAKVGDLFQIVHVGGDVFHPVTLGKMGRHAYVRGILKINSVQEKLSIARIVKAYDAVIVGDAVRPYYQQPLIGADDLSQEDKSINGVIVQNTLGKAHLAVRDTVYIDKGSEDAVAPGDRFIVYRSGHPTQTNRKAIENSGISEFPSDIMGELVVLKTAKNTATAVVVEELNEISPGDRIKYSPQSLPPIKKYDIN